MAGFIVLGPTQVEGRTYWSAAFYTNRPPLLGLSYADEVLVETVSRSAGNRETALAAALRKKPGAELIERKAR